MYLVGALCTCTYPRQVRRLWLQLRRGCACGCPRRGRGGQRGLRLALILGVVCLEKASNLLLRTVHHPAAVAEPLPQLDRQPAAHAGRRVRRGKLPKHKPTRCLRWNLVIVRAAVKGNGRPPGAEALKRRGCERRRAVERSLGGGVRCTRWLPAAWTLPVLRESCGASVIAL